MCARAATGRWCCATRWSCGRVSSGSRPARGPCTRPAATARLRVVNGPAAPGPFTTLSRAVAAGLVHGPRAGLDPLDTLPQDQRVAQHHRPVAARAHMLELAGEGGEAGQGYDRKSM